MDYEQVGLKGRETRSASEWKENVGKPAAQKRMQVQDFEKTGKSISKTFSNEEWKKTVGSEMRRKQQETDFKLRQRPVIAEIKQLQQILKIKLGTGWTKKSDEWLQQTYERLQNAIRVHGQGDKGKKSN